MVWSVAVLVRVRVRVRVRSRVRVGSGSGLGLGSALGLGFGLGLGLGFGLGLRLRLGFGLGLGLACGHPGLERGGPDRRECDGDAPAGLEHPQSLAEGGGLIRREAEGTVGDDRIHGGGGKG